MKASVTTTTQLTANAIRSLSGRGKACHVARALVTLPILELDTDSFTSVTK
jgi:hypothetical protein